MGQTWGLVDLYFFDLDKTLYAYDFRERLPALSRFSGVSQYHLASTWWAGGFERRAGHRAGAVEHEGDVGVVAAHVSGLPVRCLGVGRL